MRNNIKQKSQQHFCGFTLIELLISISIFFIIATILGICTNTLNRGLLKPIQTINNQEKAYLFLDEISDDIHNLYYRKNQFEIIGSSNHLTFTTLKKDIDNYLSLKNIEYKSNNTVIEKTERNTLDLKNTLTKTISPVSQFSLSYLIDNNWQEFCKAQSIPFAIRITFTLNDKSFSTIAKINMQNTKTVKESNP